jgi:hypothetical protein
MLPLLAMLSLACGPRDPAWALDPVHLEPDGVGGATGYHTWHLYDARFERAPRERTYACGAVFELVATPGACDACSHAWWVETSLLETDCDPIALDPSSLPTLSAVGLAPMGGDLAVLDPYPGVAQLAFAAYDTGPQEAWGWAWPSRWETHGEADGPAWNDRQAFTLWPAYVWELDALEGAP